LAKHINYKVEEDEVIDDWNWQEFRAAESEFLIKHNDFGWINEYSTKFHEEM